jgi:hypothetical protein
MPKCGADDKTGEKPEMSGFTRRPAQRLSMLGLACLAFLSGCAHRNAVVLAGESAVANESSPYAGFGLGQTADGGAIVLGVIAGPAALAGLQTGDKIDSAAGEQVNAARLIEMIRGSAAHTRLPLRVVRDGRVLDLDFVVGDWKEWAAPAVYPARFAFTEIPARATPVWLDEIEAKVAAAAPDLVPARDRVQRMLDDLARDDMGYNKLRMIRHALADPGSLIDWEHRLVAELKPATELNTAARNVATVLCEILAVDCSAVRVTAQDSSADAPARATLAEFTESIAGANRRVRDAFAASQPRDLLFGDLRFLLQEIATKRTLVEQPEALRGIRAMQASMHVDSAALLDAFGRLTAIAGRVPESSPPTRRNIPAALAAMVEGEILDYAQVDGGYVVIGGPGANRYRMDRLYAVIDTGGEDQYVWGEGVPLETQIVVDLAGNDRYEASCGGPGAGWLGISVLIDMAGDDTYASALGGCGAGAFGFGLLFDAAGADTYRCDAWSIGAGIYGGGVLIDAGDGWDTYLSQSMSQGVGGPAGVGLLIDAGGDDLYRANAQVPSDYGTPTTFMSFSQGVGFGIRPYDHGGFGALIDYGGNDRYEGGEFSQGGGYFWGVGLLHDVAGNDFHYGGRYTQGFAAHQAAGLFSDVAGDDFYWAMRAAAQGAAWDQSVAMMFDGGGNDVYRAESLAQGAAAQQSRAWLFDAGGNDVYWSGGDSAQGVAGDNAYHYRADDPVESLGVLLDAGGDDRYSTGLVNGAVRIRHMAGNPANAVNQSGVAIDESP